MTADVLSNSTLRRSGNAWSKQTDEELLLHYRESGDRGPFDELVSRYEREIYTYLRRFLGDPDSAEDAFQGTFLQVHLKGDQFEEGRKFRPWLYAIATNQAIDLQRRNKRHRMISLDSTNRWDGEDDLAALVNLVQSDDPSPAAQAESEEGREWIRQTVAELPEQYRSAVILVYYQGLKYREAAEALSIPVGTVKSRLHSALLKLNEAWRS